MDLLRILLIEDSLGDIELTKQALKNGKIPTQLDVVTDGEAALNFLLQKSGYENAERPDLILLDLNLPKINGKEVLKNIKESPELRQIPTLILSSSDAVKDIQESYNLHANCFITKPVHLADFFEVVKTIENFWVDIAKLPHTK